MFDRGRIQAFLQVAHLQIIMDYRSLIIKHEYICMSMYELDRIKLFIYDREEKRRALVIH